MTKRVQERKEERIVTKYRPTAMNMSSIFSTSLSSAKNLITSSDPEKLAAAAKPASRTSRNSRFDEAPSSQVKLKDVYFGGMTNSSAEKLVVIKENQISWECSESIPCSVHKDEATDELVAYNKGAGKFAASSISENS